MYDCNKLIVIGVSQLNPFHRWQIQVLMGADVIPTACFSSINDCPPDLAHGVGVLFLTERKPNPEQVTQFTHVFHAPLRPASAPTLKLSRLLPNNCWRPEYETCLPTKRQAAVAELERQRHPHGGRSVSSARPRAIAASA